MITLVIISVFVLVNAKKNNYQKIIKIKARNTLFSSDKFSSNSENYCIYACNKILLEGISREHQINSLC